MIDEGGLMYLDLMKKVLTNLIYEDPPLESSVLLREQETRKIVAALPENDRRAAVNLLQRNDHDSRLRLRIDGQDWPATAHTMIGMKRLDNLQHCVRRVVEDGVPGDLIETGVWRGGACIFMRAALKAHGVADRRVWVADSFAGMPETTDASYPGDRELALHEYNADLAVPLDTVRANFERYGLLDDAVRFLPGWFSDTLPTAPIERLAVMRLDGDLYESTMDALVNLYPKLSPGGYVIIDDYVILACREAVHDFRDRHGIDDPIVKIDDAGSFWRRGATS
ncbi:TylF/MycF family methyltransferase [Amycolatopsis rubida]|uniref:O-methyltransferase/8-demethyl-8-(2,3-dimethoxy-alpha-L-rhamnosyl)tetracenomycin-C 4'-O-methyltransferase n=1 Tax=Amycolatopsis rubida TaxID=112413 RepID=A0A1I5TN02_9PSEU|nr:TylF/MycF family methyltransferase [Amycolatopsis rubida]SFP83997.1 O-methyltransferase/8-demethyl-8-(2,3-dimethoxy-alpha-L-rhamnosyl)tetracenomycin-C 4'-O-methyltransferase [Amycolatopsis rubida]